MPKRQSQNRIQPFNMDLAGIAPATPRCERGILLLYYRPLQDCERLQVFNLYYCILIDRMAKAKGKPVAARHVSIVSPSTRKKLEPVLKTVLRDVKPSEKEMEQMTFYSNQLILRLLQVAPKDVEIISAGSVARGTQIRGTSDIDIFLLFPKTQSEDAMEKKGIELAKKVVAKHKNESFMIKYAEHPYVRLIFNDVGLNADIVPAFKIANASERITAVDRTQLHNEFINKALTARQRDDVRILKAFLKAHNIYGAGAEFDAFSGYLCELLVHHYGSFIDVVSAFATLKLPKVILPLNRGEHKQGSEELKNMVKKFNKDFIVIDPTDPDRNVAAVVSKEAVARLSVAARLLLGEPSIKVFYGPRYSEVYSERKITHLRDALHLNVYTLAFKMRDIAPDILWQQLRRLKGKLEYSMKKEGFHVVLSLENISGTTGVIALLISDAYVGHFLAEGPSAFMNESAGRFLAAHPKALGIFFKEDRILALEEARYNTPKELITDLLSNDGEFPSYLKKKNMRLFMNNMPEDIAKLVYSAFIRKTTI